MRQGEGQEVIFGIFGFRVLVSLFRRDLFFGHCTLVIYIEKVFGGFSSL